MGPTLPDEFAWTIQFGSLGGDDAGLLVYGPPTVGTSLDSFLQNDAGTWNTYTFDNGAPGSFGARLTAVPEPGVLALGVFGGLTLFGFARFRKK